MKRAIALTFLFLFFCLSLCGCFPRIKFIPSSETIGESKVFEKDGIRLTLTDHFIEQESERGFYAYYVSGFCGVVVSKEEFSSEEGLAERSSEEYISDAIEKNGHTDIVPQHEDGLWFYETDGNGTNTYAYVYKSSDAFWGVQFICSTIDAPMLEEQFYLWANCVEVE